ncbi:hypothetical protein FEM03_00110 [Phragmitibacter flavus]|uniref:Class I SAM-dependent methyltransferase n=1 Tax=Phragmitibacter flavus TaxID=2576071 RepID=A0A5R8KJL7_9BACT|nr:hypothetical protein FEM03_00110 [Phragmitibacter flavus]
MLEREHPELHRLLQQPETLNALQQDEIPVPCTEDREGYYGECHLGFWLSGLQDKLMVTRLIPASKKAQCILDFGGASGRVARHWLNADPKCNVVLADLNINHIDYVSKHFPTRLRPIKLSSQPQLMLPDNC